MSIKNYLSQIKILDMRIDAKIEQLAVLNTLARSATSVLTGMPHSPNKGASKLEDTMVKIIDLQEEINRDIDELVDMKRDAVALIKSVPVPEQQAVLEKRYLCFQSWDTIAKETGYSMRYLLKLHDRGLKNISFSEKEDT